MTLWCLEDTLLLLEDSALFASPTRFVVVANPCFGQSQHVLEWTMPRGTYVTSWCSLIEVHEKNPSTIETLQVATGDWYANVWFVFWYEHECCGLVGGTRLARHRFRHV